ncbi:hypothetical protein [Jatrophihabitans sp. GAS493]|uniref:hypothetical protein n=1 Tax=Jatrophihabitans sp. GAS493 TaxID=1907575 RepID=UPI0012FD5E8B|nr:hypothetical protein [Jatrophihabitans sp. GAS493]
MSQSPPDWLPDSLVPVAYKLARADELAWEIFTIAIGWSSKGPLHLESRIANGREFVHLRGIDPIPPILSLVLGDAINQLRSTLDHAVLALIEDFRQESIPESVAHRVNFPIYEDREKFDRWVQRAPLAEMAPDAEIGHRIFQLQPFNDLHETHFVMSRTNADSRHPGPGDHPLLLLQAYSNNDKHRRLVLSAARNVVTTSSVSFDQIEQHTPEDGELVAGTDLYSVRAGTTAVLDLNPYAAIRRPTTGSWQPPGREIWLLHSYLAERALPILSTGTTDHSIPPQIDLRGPEIDPYQRLREAGRTYAFQRTFPMISKLLGDRPM